ncbi:MAG TPA: hypothetical protein VMB34_23965 [Acetobacteraceae bacterium]|nr:hypothetical protein [Acetobacteraceae bacterium]
MERLRDTAFGAPRSQDDAAPLRLDELESCPTPGQIVSQIGLVIAVCLGLGLLARMLVAIVGVY